MSFLDPPVCLSCYTPLTASLNQVPDWVALKELYEALPPGPKRTNRGGDTHGNDGHEYPIEKAHRTMLGRRPISGCISPEKDHQPLIVELTYGLTSLNPRMARARSLPSQRIE